MARIAGVNLPNQKRLEIGLTYIFGIGQPTAQKICDKLGLSRDTKVRDLTEDEVAKLRDLHRRRTTRSRATCAASARRRSSACPEIGAYRGLRHRRNLPARGQRTKTNARTRKGPKKTVGRGKKAK